MLLGNYPQAKSSYCEALSLYITNFTTNEILVDCMIIYEMLKKNVQWTFVNPIIDANPTKHEKKLNVVNQNVAHTLSLVSEILMVVNFIYYFNFSNEYLII